MRSFQLKAVATLLTILIVCATLQDTEAHRVKKLIKAGLVIGALASKKLPRVLPLPIPIPVHLNKEQEFGGGHFGNEYYGTGYGYGPAIGTGGYQYGAGGFGQGIYGGGGYGAEWY